MLDATPLDLDRYGDRCPRGPLLRGRPSSSEESRWRASHGTLVVVSDMHIHDFDELGRCEGCGATGLPGTATATARAPGGFDDLVRAMRKGGAEVTICEMRAVELGGGLLAVETIDERGEVLHASLVEGDQAHLIRRVFVEAAPDAAAPPLSG